MAAYIRYYAPGAYVDYPAVGAGLVSAAFVKGVEDFLVNTPTRTPTADTDNQIVPASDTVVALAVGNDAAANYGPNTGSPAGNYIPFKIQHLVGTAGTPITQTRQGGVGWTKYKERTVDDSMEGFSFGVIATSAYGGFASPQTLPVIGLEGDALIQGTASVSNKTIGVGGKVSIQDTAHSDSTVTFYGGQTSIATGATITNRYCFYDEGITGSGTITNNWSLYGKHDLQTEKRLIVGKAGADATLTHAFIVGASGDTVGTFVAQAGTSQTSAQIVVRDSGGVQRGQWFGQSGSIFIGNTASGGGGVGHIVMVTATAPTGSAPSHGVRLYVDPADDKLKAVGSSGTVTVLALP